MKLRTSSLLDRFRNPFLQHALASIALNHEAKVKTRLLPTLANYRARFGKPAPLLSAALGPWVLPAPKRNDSVALLSAAESECAEIAKSHRTKCTH